jgi:hypothetical protein
MVACRADFGAADPGIVRVVAPFYACELAHSLVPDLNPSINYMASMNSIVTTRHTVSQDTSESAARAASLHDCHVDYRPFERRRVD